MRTVTDNGSNFCKSFRQFGPRSGIAATAHRPPVEDMCNLEEVLGPQTLDLNEGEAGADGGQDLDGEIEDDATEYVHVADILAQGSGQGGLYKLQEHLRCADHTMNLVATTDVKVVLENDRFHQSAIEGKANELWKKQRASTNAMETIQKYV